MPDALTSPAAGRTSLKAGLWAAGIFSLAVLLVFYETTWSIISIWERSDTYAHGFLIVPIVIWLIWNKREVLAAHRAQPVFWVQLLIVPGGLIWLLAYLVDVLVIQQVALVGILIVGTWSIIGHNLARILAFPLGFLLLAVPMGEDLVPSMMELTASSTVWLIQLTGIPVYREGLYFTLPSGNWSVVEACSGVRYLIASVTLGLLYAHLTYRSLTRQLLFVLVSILVPVAANTLRAYIIVMLGHISDMTVATGVDHLIYGWVFFGLVMAILFWLGSFWREDDKPREAYVNQVFQAGNSRTSLVTVSFTAILIAGLWPFFAQAIEQSRAYNEHTTLQAPPSVDDWLQTPEEKWDWQPVDAGASAEIAQFYGRADTYVALYVQQYMQQQQGAELVSGKGDEFIDPNLSWRITERENIQVLLGSKQVQVNQFFLSAGGQRLILWNWYRIGHRYTANAYVAKWYQVLAAITFGRQDAARIVVAAPVVSGETTRDTLQDFINAYLPAIEGSLDAAARERWE